MTARPAVPAIERTSPNDLMQLASESAAAPMQVAALLLLDRPVGIAQLRAALAERVRAVPRLRQRLQRAPLGCGRPFWVDDTGFAIDRHISAVPGPPPGDEAALLSAAAVVATRPLPRDRPLWSITVVDRPAGRAEAGSDAVVLVMHHVVADGIGGLAVLASLIDNAPPVSDARFPAPRPTARELLADALASRLGALRRWRSGWWTVRDAVAGLRTGVPHATRSSINQRIGRQRSLAVARSDLDALAAVAHAGGGTINDVLLTAVGGALAGTLRGRGEAADSFVVSMPVSSRPTASARQLGNRVGVQLVHVPGVGELSARLAITVERTRRARETREAAATAALLGPVFRLLARFGIFRWFVDRQRIVTTFVTNLRGPKSQMTLLGATITDVVPITSITGNVTVAFAALSYAGCLTVTVIADPEHCPDLPLLAAQLQAQFDELTQEQNGPSRGAVAPTLGT